MGRVFRKLRSSGQDVPPCDLRTREFLQLGVNLIQWLPNFPVDRAAEAWEAHSEKILADWKEERQRMNEVEYICFGARIFDNTPQISKMGLDESTKANINGIEGQVMLFKKGRLKNE